MKLNDRGLEFNLLRRGWESYLLSGSSLPLRIWVDGLGSTHTYHITGRVDAGNYCDNR